MMVAAGWSTLRISTDMPESGPIIGFPSTAVRGACRDCAGTTSEYGSMGANKRLHDKHCCQSAPTSLTRRSSIEQNLPRPPNEIGNWLDRSSRIPSLYGQYRV